MIDHIYQLIISPFIEFAFMRRALIAIIALALSSAPLGVMLSLRNMSLFGEALSHAVLPGVAVGFIFFGLSLPALSLGGFIAGVIVVMLSGLISRHTQVKEDASLAVVYLIALALGVILISQHGTQLDLLHILFGNILGVDDAGLLLIAIVSTSTLLLLSTLYRGLLLESFDPTFLVASGAKRSRYQQIFLLLVVLNLVASFQTLGTLMAVGLMMLPAISSRFWHETLPGQFVYSVLISALSGCIGLLISFYVSLPSGPVIIVCAGVAYILSLLLAPYGWGRKLFRRPHFKN